MPASPIYRKTHLLVSPGFLLALVLLLVNDHVLKAAYPGWFTGKLSDFAGLFCFPLFFVALLPKYGKSIYILTAFGFLYWKLPLSNGFIELIATQFHFEIQRTLDYSDWMALLILPFSYKYSFRKATQPAPWQTKLYWASGMVAIVAFVATSPVKHELMYNPYPHVLASGFYNCEYHDSLVYLCSEKTDIRLEVPVSLGDSVTHSSPAHFSLVDTAGKSLSDIKPNYVSVLHPFGIVYSTNYSRASPENRLGLLDFSGKRILHERYRILASLYEHSDLSVFQLHKRELDSANRLTSPSPVLFLQCRTDDSVYVMDENLTVVTELAEKSIQVLSKNALLVTRQGTREPIDNPIGVKEHDFLMKHELDFPGTRYAIIGLDGQYLVPPIIEALFYSGGDLWTLVCGTDLLVFDANSLKVVREVERKFPSGILMSHREIPSRATFYKGQWSLVDQGNSRTFRFPTSNRLDNSLVALQFMLKLWNADEQRKSYAWVCFDFNGMPIGVRQQYVAVELKK